MPWRDITSNGMALYGGVTSDGWLYLPRGSAPRSLTRVSSGRSAGVDVRHAKAVSPSWPFPTRPTSSYAKLAKVKVKGASRSPACWKRASGST